MVALVYGKWRCPGHGPTGRESLAGKERCGMERRLPPKTPDPFTYFGGKEGWGVERRLSPKTPDPIYLSRQVRHGNLEVQAPALPATAGAKNRLVCNGFSNCLWRLKDENKGELLLWR